MTPLLRVERLCLALDGRTVLHDIDFSCGRAEFVGLVGPNGCGKSTLLRCLAGTLKAQRGRIEIAGQALQAGRSGGGRAYGYAVEPEVLPAELSGRQCLRLIARLRGLAMVPDETLQLAARLRLTPWLDRSIATYSVGTRQKLSILLALLGSPPLILLDEALNGLDPVSRYLVKEHLQTQVRLRGATVLLATQSIEVAAAFFDRVIVMHDGRIAQHWPPAQLHAWRSQTGFSLERQIVDALRAAEE